MLFPTVQFAIFFPIVLALSWALMSRPTLWKPFIVVASYVFYAAANWRFCLLLGGVTLGNQAAARLIHRTDDERRRKSDRRRRGRARPRRPGGLQVLRLLRAERRRRARRRRARAAAAAADDRAAGRRQLLHLPGDLVRRRRQAAAWSSPRALIDVAVYLSFFPHLVAGPIVRAREFLPQLAAPRDPNRVAVGSGLALIGLGLVKKVVIADYLAREVVDPVFAVPEAYAAPDVVARRLRLHRADLLRLLRLHRHRDRPRAADGLRLPAELPQPVPRARASATSGGAGT